MSEIRKRRVLFLCVHNSSRSIMAEAIVKHFLGDKWEAFSAGTEPREVNSLAIEALREIGIEIPKAGSKHVDEFAGRQFDVVVTLCDEARESCPFWPGAGTRKHKGLPDPSAVKGNKEDRMKAFRDIRDKIMNLIQNDLLK